MDNVKILERSISNLTSNIKYLEDELKKVTKGSNEWNTAQEQLLELQQKLADKQKQLADSTKEIADSQNKTTTEIKNQNSEIQNNTKTVGDWREKLKELRNEQKELVTQMTVLNLEGKQGSKEYLELAERAGVLRDAMDDARQAMNRYADDSMRISDVIEAVQFGTGIFSTYSGVVSLLGIKSESTEKIMRKFAETTQILNGLQAINNTLMNKSSIIMRAYHGVVGLCTKATVAWTAATKGVKAAIASTGIGLLVVAVGELVTHWDDLTKSFKKFIGVADEVNPALSNINQSISKYSVYADTFIEKSNEAATQTLKNIVAYRDLAKEWNNLKTVSEKNQFLVDNKNKMHDLGISVDNVTDAENIFGKNAPIVEKLIKAQGDAAFYATIRLQLMAEEFNKFYNFAIKKMSKTPEEALETALAVVEYGPQAEAFKELEKQEQSAQKTVADLTKQLNINSHATSANTTTTSKNTTVSKDNTKALKQNIEQLKLQGSQIKKNMDFQKQYNAIYGEVNEDIINLANLDVDIETLTKIQKEYNDTLSSGILTAEEQKQTQKEFLETSLELANKKRERDILQEKIYTDDFRKEVDKRIEDIERIADKTAELNRLDEEHAKATDNLFKSTADFPDEIDGRDVMNSPEYIMEEEKWNRIIELAEYKYEEYNNLLSSMRNEGIEESDADFKKLVEKINNQTDTLEILELQKEIALVNAMTEGLTQRNDIRLKELEQEKKEREQKMQIAENVAEIYRAVSDIYAESLQKQIDAGELSQDEAEDLFEKQKKINIATALVTGLTGTFGNFALTLKDLTLQPTWFRMALAYTNLATGLATTFAQVQQIKNQTLNGASSGSKGSVTYVPTSRPILNEERDLSQLANIQQATTTNEMNIESTVVVSERDISRTQNKVNVRERNSKF